MSEPRTAFAISTFYTERHKSLRIHTQRSARVTLSVVFL